MAAGARLSALYAVQRIGVMQSPAELAWKLHAVASALTMPALGTNLIIAALTAPTSRMRHQRKDCSAWPGEGCCSPPGWPTSRSLDHGTTAGGNQHIHIALSLVREDGTTASVHNDRSRAHDTCRALEKKYEMEELSTVHASRGYDRAERQTAIRQGREMHRTSLERKVRAASTTTLTEAEFVRQGRDMGLLMRPRYAKNTTDVVVGEYGFRVRLVHVDGV